MNRARIREISEEISATLPALWNGERVRFVEATLLRAITELLTQEPSHTVVQAVDGCFINPDRYVARGIAFGAWKAMAAQLLKEVNGE